MFPLFVSLVSTGMRTQFAEPVVDFQHVARGDEEEQEEKEKNQPRLEVQSHSWQDEFTGLKYSDHLKCLDQIGNGFHIK